MIVVRKKQITVTIRAADSDVSVVLHPQIHAISVRSHAHISCMNVFASLCVFNNSKTRRSISL